MNLFKANKNSSEFLQYSLRYILISSILLAVAYPAISLAQNNNSKICLVLSGGGALGVAHVGVLKVLEEQRIPIDCIAGTSMGAIVGGLYASGYSAQELETLVKSTEWLEIFNENVPRNEKSYHRKQDDLNFLVKYRFRLDVNGNPMLPKGIIQGNKIDLSFLDFTLRSRHVDNFDDLPIPFRAVAADVETGEEVVLSKGSLAKAMKASMSIPGVFPPMVIDDKALLDGGIVNNLPIDVARNMGADIVIAVGIPTELKTKEELGGAFDIIGQVTSLLIKKNEDLQRKTLTDKDVLITPDIKGYSSASFDKVTELIEPGVISANKQISALQRYSISSLEFAKLRRKQMLLEPEKPNIAFIDINNKSGVNDNLIRSRIKTQINQPLDMDALERDLISLSGLGYFDEVLFDVVEKNNQTGIVVNVLGPNHQENEQIADNTNIKTPSLNNIQFGISLEDNFNGDNSYNIGMRLARLPINAKGGEINLDLQIGDTSKAQASLFQPIDDELNYFIEPVVSYESRNVPIFEGDLETANFRLSQGLAGVDIGRHFSNVAELRAGVRAGLGYADLRSGSSAFQAGDYDIGYYFVSASYDTLDSMRFPKKGVLLNASFLDSTEELGATGEFQHLRGNIAVANTWHNNTFILSSSANLNLDEDVAIQGNFSLGGFSNLSGYSKDQLLANNYTLHQLLFYREWNADSSSLFKIPLYTGFSVEAANIFLDKDDISVDPDDHILAGSVFVGTETAIGPIYLGYGQAEGGNNSLYLFLGRTF